MISIYHPYFKMIPSIPDEPFVSSSIQGHPLPKLLFIVWPKILLTYTHPLCFNNDILYMPTKQPLIEWMIYWASQPTKLKTNSIYIHQNWLCLFTFNAFISIVCIVYVCMTDVSFVIDITVTKTKILLFIKYWCMEFSSLKKNFNFHNTTETTWSKNIIILHNTSIPHCISIWIKNNTDYLPGISYHSNFIDPLKEILSLYPFLLKGFWENVEFGKNK